MADRQQVHRWMKNQYDDYEADNIQTATALAEQAADQFDMHSALDDETHWIWDIACQTINYFEWYFEKA